MKRIDFENRTVTGNILGATLPMLVAQILNLLYNIVDRVYIALRIPKVGTAALGAVGLCFPIIVIITAFSICLEPVVHRCFQSIEEKSRKTLPSRSWILLFHALHLRCFPDAHWLSVCTPDTGRIRCFFECPYLCLSLYNDLPDRNLAVYDLHRNESFYQRPGLFNYRYAFCCHRSCCKPSAGSFVYLCPWFWSTGAAMPPYSLRLYPQLLYCFSLPENQN